MENELFALFRPESVAVIGASSDRRNIGRSILENLIDGGFQGPVYPVHPTARSVCSVRAFPSITEVPDQVDLAVIVVPAEVVLSVVSQCAEAGVRALVVISAGFKEAGGEGTAREQELRRIVASSGMRMVGPNCMGLINTDPEIALNASFAATAPTAGVVAFASQSGALGEAILATAAELGIGLSGFVSLGNKADVSGNDLLEHWERDDRTRVILLYLESFGNPHKFSRIARRITRSGKPICVVKSGRSAAGARATESHTGSLAGLDHAATTLLEQCGVLRVDKVSDLFTVARGFANQPLPRGRRTAVLTNAGGPGIMAADALAHQGLLTAELSPQTERALRQVLPEEASVRNPVDMIASAVGETYERCVSAILADPEVDALITIFVSPATVDAVGVAEGISRGVDTARAVGAVDKPVLCTFMGGAQGQRGRELLQSRGVPVFDFPESAVQALSAMCRYHDWLVRPEGEIPDIDVDTAAADALLETAEQAGREWLDPRETFALLSAAGLHCAPHALAPSPEAAAAAAADIGFPVAIKLDHRDVLHKSDLGGVLLDLEDEAAVRDGCAAMLDRLRDEDLDTDGTRFLVQPMVQGGIEIILGAMEDPLVGHLLLFGLGGVFVELMRDVSFKVHPLTTRDAYDMVRGIRGAPMLEGFRGRPAVDPALLEDAVLRLDALLAAYPRITEVDINPLIVVPGAGTPTVVDARIRIGGGPTAARAGGSSSGAI